MIDLPIGTVFHVAGRKIIVREEIENGCGKCAFRHSDEEDNLFFVCRMVECGFFDRKDGHYVYFEEVEE
jgi:uncharacterized cysteine cluster protein YcgN (CxxCxxCC family)